MLQVCKDCLSSEVARCAWVNVNNKKVYEGEDAGTALEWCMTCKDETTIVDAIDVFKPHGFTHISNTGGIQVMLNRDNDGVWYRIVTDRPDYEEEIFYADLHEEDADDTNCDPRSFFLHGETQWFIDEFTSY